MPDRFDPKELEVIGTYNADKFYFQSGDIAIVDDTQRYFVYNSYLDTWTEWNT